MPKALEFKGNLPQITRLKINTTNVSEIDEILKEKKRGAPLMMVGMQVIVDLTECDTTGINLKAIQSCLMDEGVMPIGVITDDFSLAATCTELKLGFIPPFKRDSKRDESSTVFKNSQDTPSEPAESVTESSKPTQDSTSESEAEKEVVSTEPPVPEVENMLITRQIRSGQRIYAKGDLTIVGAVSMGAEVIADGNIHIYGALRGRAVAGAQGDASASVFCQDFAGELVSIAGFYVGAEDMDPQYNRAAVQISLNEEKIKFYRL